MKKSKIILIVSSIFACFIIWQACQKDEEPATLYRDVETMQLKSADGFDCSTVCLDPDAPEYFVAHDQIVVGWAGTDNNKFTKTVEVKYYNTLTHFVLQVMSSNGIADVLMDDESIKNFDGTIPPDEWHEFSFELEADWESCDTWGFELEIAGFGPPAYFEVEYPLIGECIYYTLTLAVNPEDAGTVTGEGEYMEGGEAALTATANEGWEFVNWTYEDGNEISPTADFMYSMPAEDHTLTANFEETTFELSIAVNPEGAGTVTGEGEYIEGGEVALTATANEGWEFVNWTDGDDAEISNLAGFTYTMPAYDVTLTANFDIDTDTEVGEVTNPITGKTWMDRNLGASQVATSSTDAASYGDLYQWGRGTDGHEKRTSGTTSTLSSSDTPGHENFITIGSYPGDWRSPHNDNLWQGVSGINNPCPSGYRLPTVAEWEAERNSWSSNNTIGAFASSLKLPGAGIRYCGDGLLSSGGSLQGFYWSSTVYGISSLGLFLGSGSTTTGSNPRANGFSVRCIKD